MFIQSLSKTLYKSKVIHPERLQSDKPCIYIANHTSLLDAVLLFTHLPKEVVFVVKNDASNKYKTLLKGKEIITVTPSNPYSVRDMLNVLKAGKSIVIFPEGRITLTGNLMKMYTGVAYLAYKTGFDIIPIAINGAVKAKKLSYIGDKIQTQWFPNTSLYVGNSFKLVNDESLSTKENKEKGTKFIYNQMQELLFESRMPESVNLVEMFRQSVAEAPDFVIAEEVNMQKRTGDESVSSFNKITMKELWRKVLALSKVLSNECKEDRVGLLLPTSITAVSTLYAVLKNGHSPVMLNFSMDVPTLSTCLETADLKSIITSKAFIEKGKLTPFIEANPHIKFIYLEDIAKQITKRVMIDVLLEEGRKVTGLANDVVLFTSGSEGKPKGVVLTQKNIYANVLQGRLMIDLTSKDKILNSLPMFHSFGFLMTFLTTLGHIPIFLMPSPLAYREIPEIAYEKKATVLVGTSSFLNAYGKQANPYDFFSMRYVIAGAEKCQDHVRDLYMEKFGIRILEGYGLTETTLLLNIQTQINFKKNTVGRFVPGVEHQLEPVEGLDDSVGKLLVKGPNISKGYLIHGKGFIPNPEWFDTGDIVSIDNEGFSTIQGRQKLFVKVAGEMVSLTSVEKYAKLALNVEDVIAIGLPDNKKGERIVLVSFGEDLDMQLVRDFWKVNKLTPLSLPDSIHTLKEKPLLGSGKVDRIKIKKYIEAELV